MHVVDDDRLSSKEEEKEEKYLRCEREADGIFIFRNNSSSSFVFSAHSLIFFCLYLLTASCRLFNAHDFYVNEIFLTFAIDPEIYCQN